MGPDAVAREPIRLRSLQPAELPALVAYWNRSFSDRRNFGPLTEAHFRRRVLECPAFNPGGLILAWRHANHCGETIAGLVHAFRPPPPTPAYTRWGRHHTVAVIHVDAERRRQGIGGRLLKAAEQWLHYCPVHFAGQSVPCYGGVEGPQAPFFGSTQRMGVNAKDSELVDFLRKRGYAPLDPGDVSMSADLVTAPRSRPTHAVLDSAGLRLVNVSHQAPYAGREPDDRPEYSTWRDNVRDAYAGLILVDDRNMLRGHLCWYPLSSAPSSPSTAAIYAFWVEPALRGRGLGSLLLDTALADMVTPSAAGGPFRRAEVQTHLVRHPDAVVLYESRGFHIDDAWVTLVKT